MVDGESKRDNLPGVNKEFYKNLKREIGNRPLGIWFPGTRVERSGENLRLYVQNDFVAGNIRDKYGKQISSASGVGSNNIDYVVCPELKDNRINFEELFEEWLPLIDQSPSVDQLQEKRKYNTTFYKVSRASLYPQPVNNLIIYSGNRKAIRSMDDLLETVESPQTERFKEPKLIYGPNASGKTATLAYLISKLKEREIPVGYVDVAALSEFFKTSQGRIPGWYEAAKKGRVVIIDELRQIFNPEDQAHRVGTQKKVRELIDNAQSRNAPLIFSYTGSKEEYQKELTRLMGDKLDHNGKRGNKDLGSRLKNVIGVEVEGLNKENRIEIVSKLFTEKYGLENSTIIEEATQAVNEILPADACMRRISGAVSTVVYDAHLDGGQVNAQRVRDTLGEVSETLFGGFSNQQQVIRSVTDYSGISDEHIKGNSKSQEVSNARTLVAWALNQQGYGHSEIGRYLGKNHATVIGAVKRVKEVLGADVENLNPRQRALRNFIEGWSQRELD